MPGRLSRRAQGRQAGHLGGARGDAARGRHYTPVKIAVWDSGVDTNSSPTTSQRRTASVPVIAFDRFSEPAKGELQEIPGALRARCRSSSRTSKASPTCSRTSTAPRRARSRAIMSTLKPDEYKAFVEEIGLAGNWMHGTHVAGIAVAGNPYARLVVGRIEFDWHLIPDPCPTRELTLRDAKNAQSYVDFFKQQGVRVVNMSWGGSVKVSRARLSSATSARRPTSARRSRATTSTSRRTPHQGLCERARHPIRHRRRQQQRGRSFVEDIPAGIMLPNLLTVGAVDKAGDEASFTSYGPTVKVHANGYQVESVFPEVRSSPSRALPWPRRRS